MLLIALCPNIEILKVDEPVSSVDEVLKRANSKNFTSVALQKLREVRVINTVDDKRTYNACGFLYYMKYFHRLPSIESITAQSICIGVDQFFRLAPRKSNISKIFINHSSMPTHKLRTIIEHPKALKEFRLVVGGRVVVDETGSDCCIQPKGLGRALQLHKSSLRVLDLDVDSIKCQGTIDEAGEVESENDDESDLSDRDSDSNDTENTNTTSLAFPGISWPHPKSLAQPLDCSTILRHLRISV